MTMDIRLVGCNRFVSPRIKKEVVLRGERVTVEDADGAVLLEERFSDALNNEHYLFEDVTGTEEVAPEEGAPPVKRPVVRSRPAKAA